MASVHQFSSNHSLEATMNPDLLEKEIPNDILLGFLETKITLGGMKNVSSVKQHQVHTDKFRINVWVSELGESKLIPSNRIAHSYYIMYENMDDGITDLTKYSDEV